MLSTDRMPRTARANGHNMTPGTGTNPVSAADRLTRALRDRGKDLIDAGSSRLTGAVRSRGTAAAVVGAVVALAGAGTASAATLGTATSSPVSPSAADGLAAGQLFASGQGQPPFTATLLASLAASGHSHGDVTRANHGTGHVRAASARRSPSAITSAAVSHKLTTRAHPAAAAPRPVAPADRLMPTAPTGPQQFMAMSPAQVQNARTIAQQALKMRMGVRSAVIAVATAMQESQLQNINYGTSDSLGLFQQQPDMGWGSAQQIMNPVYSSDAFLRALAHYQASNPGWATQPLWQAAQGVQASAAPLAYAQWETQAAQLVNQVIR